MTQRPENLRKELEDSIAEQQALIGAVVPRAFSVELSWKLIATGFLARFQDQLGAIDVLVKSGHTAEAALVLRAIYEHVVMFCWLAADPDARMAEWYEGSERGRLVSFDEAEQEFEIETPEEFRDERDRREMVRLRNLPRRARAADAYWSEKLPAFRPVQKGLSGLLTLTGMYTAVYRPLSRPAHAEADTFNAAMQVTASQIVVTSETRLDPVPLSSLGLCIPLVSLALMVFAHHFEGLDRARIKAISDTMAQAIEDDPPEATHS